MTALTIMDFSDPPQTSRGLWVGAAIGAVAFHAALIAVGVMTFQPEEANDDIGAPALEIALDMTAPRSDPSDLPPGPEAEASAASPAQVEQVMKTEETSLPKDEPVESETPDRIVTTQEAKKPDPEKKEESKVQTNASQESIASEATAPPSSETAREAPVSAAPVQGMGATAQRVRAEWQKRLVAHLDRHKKYPPGEARRSANVVVAFTLDRTGHIVSSSVSRGSGDPSFDAAALAMMARSDPVPQPPPLIADEQLSFTVPVVFRAKK